MDREKSFVFFTLALFFTCIFCLWGGIRAYNAISMNIACTGHLKRAADANTIDLAKQELKIAVEYLERYNITQGSTALVFHTPDADVGFWYTNLKASLDEINKLDPNSSQLEKTNTLMKLRETLLDHGEKGESITCPEGISIFPYNWLFYIWGLFSFFAMLFFGFLFFLFIHN